MGELVRRVGRGDGDRVFGRVVMLIRVYLS